MIFVRGNKSKMSADTFSTGTSPSSHVSLFLPQPQTALDLTQPANLSLEPIFGGSFMFVSPHETLEQHITLNVTGNSV